MRYVDRVLQDWRIRQCCRQLPDAKRVIDVGAFQGELFRALGDQLEEGFGVEPLSDEVQSRGRWSIHPGYFPEVAPEVGEWDAITMLAVLEHIPRDRQSSLVAACHWLLRVGGRVVITVPGPAVDRILDVLKKLRLIDGMSLEEHFGFQPEETLQIFAEPRFALIHRSKFQLGLNHLFVFEKLA